VDLISKIKELIEVEDRIRDIDRQIDELEKEKRDLMTRFEFLIAEMRKMLGDGFAEAVRENKSSTK